MKKEVQTWFLIEARYFAWLDIVNFVYFLKKVSFSYINTFSFYKYLSIILPMNIYVTSYGFLVFNLGYDMYKYFFFAFQKLKNLSKFTNCTITHYTIYSSKMWKLLQLSFIVLYKPANSCYLNIFSFYKR